MSDQPGHSGYRLPRRFHFARHVATFAVVTASILTAETLTGSDWPMFWPLAGWSAVIAIHYFLASSYDLDSGWVEERVAELRSRSYDFDHIQNIERRVREGDPSVTPGTERDRDA